MAGSPHADFKVAVVGAGPAGLTAALALATAGVETVLISKSASAVDKRTTALLTGSVYALDALGVWQFCRNHAAPLTAIRIVDDTSRLLRAPEVRFEAAEIGLDAFGQNIENRNLVSALEKRTQELSLARIEDTAQTIEIGANYVTITLAGGGTVKAALVVGADGRRSLCREAAGIETENRTYQQSALTLNVTHARPHNSISTEFHTESGPFTFVPLPGDRSSLVWVMAHEEAANLKTLDERELSDAIEHQAHSFLGRIEAEPGSGLYPLATQRARRLGANRVALVGEAAHVLPPIGAQGLNLGLRDAATIAELVASADRDGNDVGAPALLGEYDERRRADIVSRTMAIDLLNRSLLTDFLPVQGVRGLGLYLLDRIGPLRRALMREGVTPATSEPRLMRGEAL
ncbi:MAG TPA: UbiH/UbiF family hydroxylase [Xanthobacteraceae bacterium]|nr:UbiH/UbiF family hydroxylase [Xanthobacteraceae bacterium]